MKDIKTFLNENTEDMYYKQILTFTISDDDSRDSFIELLESMSFKNMPDQSTWALPFSSALNKLDVANRIIRWSMDEEIIIDKKDFVQIFRATAVKVADNNHQAGIDSRTLVYDSKTQGLK